MRCIKFPSLRDSYLHLNTKAMKFSKKYVACSVKRNTTMRQKGNRSVCYLSALFTSQSTNHPGLAHPGNGYKTLKHPFQKSLTSTLTVASNSGVVPVISLLLSSSLKPHWYLSSDQRKMKGENMKEIVLRSSGIQSSCELNFAASGPDPDSPLLTFHTAP
jgi:hypothetical protein